MFVSAENGIQSSSTSDTSVVILGTAAALADFEHANTYLAVVRQGRYWLVDCADSPIGRLQQVGLDPLEVRGVIITHFHPDHVFGLPIYLMGLYLMGFFKKRVRREPLAIYAPVEALQLVRAMIGLFQMQSWTDMFSMEYHPIELRPGCVVAEDEDFSIVSTPTHHSVSSIALRFLAKDTGHSLVYSSDTAPCPEVEALAWGANLLIHEASGAGFGHTSAAEAGAVAAHANAARLLLVHYFADAKPRLLAEAQRTFSGPVQIAEDLTTYAW
jgi:ribonuclease Z